MSLWICAEHGLYGGQLQCPQCGKIGDWATVTEEQEPVPPPPYVDPAIRHAWDDLKEELERDDGVGK